MPGHVGAHIHYHSPNIRPTFAQYSSNNIKTRKHDWCVIKRLKGLLGWGSMLASTHSDKCLLIFRELLPMSPRKLFRQIIPAPCFISCTRCHLCHATKFWLLFVLIDLLSGTYTAFLFFVEPLGDPLISFASAIMKSLVLGLNPRGAGQGESFGSSVEEADRAFRNNQTNTVTAMSERTNNAAKTPTATFNDSI